MKLFAVQGDLAQVVADAVVRPVVAGTHRSSTRDDLGLLRSAGPEAEAAFVELLSLQYPSGWEAGTAFSTTGGVLPARWLIHVAVPQFDAHRREHLLAAAYRSVLEVADGLSVTRLALTPLGMVTPYWPLEVATRVANSTLRNTITRVHEVRLVVRTPAALEVLTVAMARY